MTAPGFHDPNRPAHYPGDPRYTGQPPFGPAWGYNGPPPAATAPKSRITAGVLGLFLGWCGVHRFYLGFTGIGVAQIIVTVVTLGIGGLWGFIEGILYLAKVLDADATGRPLAD